MRRSGILLDSINVPHTRHPSMPLSGYGERGKCMGIGKLRVLIKIETKLHKMRQLCFEKVYYCNFTEKLSFIRIFRLTRDFTMTDNHHLFIICHRRLEKYDNANVGNVSNLVLTC